MKVHIREGNAFVDYQNVLILLLFLHNFGGVLFAF